MERLTYEQVIERTEKLKTAKIYASKEEYFALDEIIQPMLELQKYKQLEKGIGCSLGVRCSIYNDMKIYCEDGHTYKVIDIDFTSMKVDGITTLSTRNIPYCEYGKTWWFKQDRSE